MSEATSGRLAVLDPVDLPTKYPRALGRQPLNNVSQVREECARVYRAVAAGRISAKAGSALAYQLSTVAKLMEIEKGAMLEEVEHALREAQKGRGGR